MNYWILVLAILLIGGAGVGGYYLGQYLDTKALNEKYISPADTISEWVEYTSTDLNVTFSHPPTWTVLYTTEPDTTTTKNIKKITVTSPNKSEFVVYNAVATNYTKITEYCDKAVPNGDSTKSIEKCEFVTQDDVSFGRYVADSSTENKTTTYFVAELVSGKYTMNSLNFVSYLSTSASDLEVLDGIMISFKRN